MNPYFTATADNIGFAWWSHDIGGHMHGYKDNELYVRWIQLGVFSPVCRMHSSNNEFNTREPWCYRADACAVAEDFLRLRHRLIPYLYTMNHRAWAESQPLCQPMYYSYPEQEEAYGVANQYMFGSELLCAPITRHTAADAPVAAVPVWLPEGEWTDIFTGVTYQGGQKLDMYRDLASFPVLAKAGAILPLADDIAMAVRENPATMTLKVYAGASGRFTLYEDDNTTEAYRQGVCVLTDILYEEGNAPRLTIEAKGRLELIPQERKWTIELVHVPNQKPNVHVDGEAVEVITEYDTVKQVLRVQLPACAVQKMLTLTFEKKGMKPSGASAAYAYQLLVNAEMSMDEKEHLYVAMTESPSRMNAVSVIEKNATSSAMMGALIELCRAQWDEREKAER